MNDGPQSVKVEMVVAIARNGIIGSDGDMPWRLSTDLKRFKAITLGCPVIMGRKTFQSIGKPLPGRSNVVITRDAEFAAEGFEAVTSPDAALVLAQERAHSDGAESVFVIGGGEIYRQMLPLADRLHVTFVDAEPEGDTRFPEIDETTWEVEHAEDVPAGPKDSAATRYVIYRRR